VWVDATGKRLRRGVTGPAKTAVREAVAELRAELRSARRSSRKYTVNAAVAVWIEGGRPGRSERTWNVCIFARFSQRLVIGHCASWRR